LKELFHDQHEVIPVKDGETLSLGNMELTFMETRMIHWPDSMFTYLAKDQLLFSQTLSVCICDAGAFCRRNSGATLEYEAATYYANIVLPYSPIVLKTLKRSRQRD